MAVLAAESLLNQALHSHLQADSAYCTEAFLAFALQSTANAAVPAAIRTAAMAAKAATPVVSKAAASASKAARKTGEVAVTAAGKIAHKAQASLTQAAQVTEPRQVVAGVCTTH